tara:strand:- start:1011 stop:2276 length:1266 start_codon:yes stop_codon:yes gene_type:complete
MNFQSFILSLVSNELIILLNTFILIVFTTGILIYFFGEYNKAQRTLRIVPSLLVSTGIFGTFLGIFFALIDFNVDKVDESIPALLEGLKIAFGTSIVGLFLSLIFRIITYLFIRKSVVSEEADVKDLLAKMTEVKDAISGDNETSMNTQIQKLRTSNIDGFKDLKNSFENFAKEMAENNIGALIEAIKKVMEDFNAKINDQLGETFKQLNQSVEKLVIWQDQYKTHVDTMNEKLSKAIESISKAEDSLDKISKSMEILPSSTEELKNLITKIQHQIDNLSEHMTAFSEMKNKATNAMPEIEKNLKTITDDLTATVKTVSENINKSSDQVTSSVTSQLKSMDEMAKDMRDSYKQALKETNDALVNQIKGLDESMQKEVTRIIEIMGSKLTSLSNKFVEDYTPLTSQLANLVQSLNIKKNKLK